MTEKTMQEKSIFDKLSKIDVNGKTEKKGKFTYLSWCFAWSELQKVCPDATYEILKCNGLPYFGDNEKGYMIFTKVSANNITHEMWLPVMDYQNKTIKNPTMFDINKTIMRCLVKNIAMFGLGLYIYAGEDLPEEAQNQTYAPQKPTQAFDYEALKQELLESATQAEMETILEKIRSNAKHMNKEQGVEIKNIKENLEKHFKQLENE